MWPAEIDLRSQYKAADEESLTENILVDGFNVFMVNNNTSLIFLWQLRKTSAAEWISSVTCACVIYTTFCWGADELQILLLW